MMLQKQEKRPLLKLIEHWELNSLQTWWLNFKSILSKFKKKLRTNEAKNWQEIKNSQPQLKNFWF